MAGEQRIYKSKIRATSTLQKVFRAMELIAASRIGQARRAAQGLDPYARAVTRALGLVGRHNFDTENPLLNERTDTNRIALLVVTSDRGMAGAYSANVLREAENTMATLREEGKEPVLYVAGRRGVQYFGFRGIKVEQSWTGFSDKPDPDQSDDIARTLLDAFSAPADQGGVAEVHVVFTRFESMVNQAVQVRHMLPLTIVDYGQGDLEDTGSEYSGGNIENVEPLYEYEPSPRAIFGKLIPMYVRKRISTILLMAAASELASRQQAMHAATDNASELIEKYTRLANNARQAEITTEITEIVSGADALSNG
ncbi:F0F1 ATP synthase subunit gamma [Actinotignum urinale]|uniref:ATP synthase gamma chain n=1 Tax=Actinotignum urinale TaxID=190146 RepID=A0AAW9HW11_9ACTO|nr:F0F1 ATP synthase subunit gamma [Actinotignum urinale]MDY5129443.1 F0F1 ATP synthase subunit gamma [Actinotignum urinale]MDY5132886.1 F0F1 ATP synthase subunit gamma [Actinotignum urinale]MDY5151610.1 F0F1 ATP synthase subunit gamma [Actinotignum urinale]MDY5155258.1 F0F1 ATP synthase subunit gamma [Actinotignum urinale]MDY5161035.1 F0F1 ATP synthase subunit gamma [Actinotignum urinale]